MYLVNQNSKTINKIEVIERINPRALGFLLLGVVFGAVLGVLGNLWAAFLVELVRNLIPPELWTVASFLGVVITTILSIYILIKVVEIAEKHIIGEERLADKTEERSKGSKMPCLGLLALIGQHLRGSFGFAFKGFSWK